MHVFFDFRLPLKVVRLVLFLMITFNEETPVFENGKTIIDDKTLPYFPCSLLNMESIICTREIAIMKKALQITLIVIWRAFNIINYFEHKTDVVQFHLQFSCHESVRLQCKRDL